MNAPQTNSPISPLPPTEARLAASAGLDAAGTSGVLRMLHQQDRVAVDAVEPVLPALTELVDEAAARFRRGGRIHYFGAGTSGRLGVLDAAELVPTYNLEPGRVAAHLAGGEAAILRAVEDAEDSRRDGARAAAELVEADVAIGLTASGATPYVHAALAGARQAGALTALVSSNPASPIRDVSDISLIADTGPEVVAGSTRLKAGTAQKLILNGFSTALMVALGRTWSNLMVSVVATNAKLRERSVRILQEATGMAEPQARETLAQADGDLKTALVTFLASVPAPEARHRLAAHQGSVRGALHHGTAAPRHPETGSPQ